jgi:FkbM family methyltransferase
VRETFRRAGYDVVRYPFHATIDGHLKRQLAVSGVDTVLDVGANIGQFGRRLRTVVGFRGRIVSFEPDPQSFERLRRVTASDADWEVHQLALGDSDGTADLHRFDGDAWNSLRLPDDAGLAAAGRKLVVRDTIRCEVRRLDSVWADVVPDRSVVFLKSDAQGHDQAVLDGASGRSRLIVGSLLEVALRRYYQGEWSLAECLDKADTLGFRPTGIFPVARSRHSLALDTVDVCFARV